MVLWGAGLLLIVAVMAAAVAWYVLGLPGKSYSGPPTPPTSAEQRSREPLAPARRPRSRARRTTSPTMPRSRKPPRYIEAQLAGTRLHAAGAGVRDGRHARCATSRSCWRLPAPTPRHRASSSARTMIQPAKRRAPTTTARVLPPSSSWRGCSKGVDLKDEARAPRAVRQRGAALRPHAQHGELPQSAAALKERGETVIGMISLETLGCFSDAPGSQKYPSPVRAHISLDGQLRRARRDAGLAQFPARGGGRVPPPRRVPDHRRHRARPDRRHRLVGPLVVLEAGLSRDHGHRHGAVPLSPLPQARPTRPTRSTTPSSRASRSASSRRSAISRADR